MQQEGNPLQLVAIFCCLQQALYTKHLAPSGVARVATILYAVATLLQAPPKKAEFWRCKTGLIHTSANAPARESALS